MDTPSRISARPGCIRESCAEFLNWSTDCFYEACEVCDSLPTWYVTEDKYKAALAENARLREALDNIIKEYHADNNARSLRWSIDEACAALAEEEKK